MQEGMPSAAPPSWLLIVLINIVTTFCYWSPLLLLGYWLGKRLIDHAGMRIAECGLRIARGTE